MSSLCIHGSNTLSWPHTKLCSKSSLYKTVPVQKNSFTKEASVEGAMPNLVFFQGDEFKES